MNLPNKLTILRVFMIPFFVMALMYENGENKYIRLLALAIFALACITDTLDGYIARKYNLITNFGKFMDPLADKLLVSAALICFVELGEIEAWVVLIVVSREFIISGFRLVASDAGVVIAASIWGKFKTTFQMLSVILIILDMESIRFLTVSSIYIMTVLTVISLVDYCYKNRNVISDIK